MESVHNISCKSSNWTRSTHQTFELSYCRYWFLSALAYLYQEADSLFSWEKGPEKRIFGVVQYINPTFPLRRAELYLSLHTFNSLFMRSLRGVSGWKRERGWIQGYPMSFLTEWRFESRFLWPKSNTNCYAALMHNNIRNVKKSGE